jgi:hypothetical protein
MNRNLPPDPSRLSEIKPSAHNEGNYRADDRYDDEGADQGDSACLTDVAWDARVNRAISDQLLLDIFAMPVSRLTERREGLPLRLFLKVDMGAVSAAVHQQAVQKVHARMAVLEREEEQR